MSAWTSAATTPAGVDAISNSSASSSSSSSSSSIPHVTSRRIADLVASINPAATLEPELEALLLELADDFVDNVVVLSALVARHRQSKLVDVKDVQLTLQQHWGIRVPGFFSPDDVLAAAGVSGAADAAAAGGSDAGGAQRDFSGGFDGLKGVRALRRPPMTEGHRRRLQAVAAAKHAARTGSSTTGGDGEEIQLTSAGEARKRKRGAD